MKTELNIPKIRFREFDGEWNEKKTGQIMEVGSVYRIHQSDWQKEGIPFIRARDIVSYLKNGDLSKDRLYISEEKYKELSEKSGSAKKGDMLITGVGTIGVPFLIRTDDPLYFKDGNVLWLKNNNVINPEFLFYNYLSPFVQREIFSFSGVGTVGTYTIDSAKKTKIIIPLKDEQKKVGLFFTKIDKLIELEDKKLEQLNKLKQGYLLKIFAEDGQKIPKLRFKGFSDDWKEETFEDEFDIIMGQSPHSENYTNNSKQNILVQGNADISNGKIHPRIYTSEITKISKINDIIMTVRAPVGELALNQYDKVVIGRGVASLSGSLFDYFLLMKIKESGLWNRFSSGSTFDAVNSSDIKSMKSSFPSKDEQKRIESFFVKMDQIIKLQTQKLESLKQQKKAYLQKMFI